MFRASGPGLRSRLVALVLLGTLPAFAVLLHGALATRDAALENGRAGVELRARSVADGQLRVLDGTSLVLRALADSEVIRSGTPEQCADFLGGFLRQNRTYSNLGIVREDGSFRASVLPIPPGVTATDRSWFREVRESDAFSVGEFQVGRVTGRPSINAAVPLRMPDGRREFLFAAIDLGHLQEVAASVALPTGGVVSPRCLPPPIPSRVPPAPSPGAGSTRSSPPFTRSSAGWPTAISAASAPATPSAPRRWSTRPTSSWPAWSRSAGRGGPTCSRPPAAPCAGS